MQVFREGANPRKLKERWNTLTDDQRAEWTLKFDKRVEQYKKDVKLR
jgi:hypothetical protein